MTIPAATAGFALFAQYRVDSPLPVIIIDVRSVGSVLVKETQLRYPISGGKGTPARELILASPV